MTKHYILYRLPMVQGWAMYSWAIENDQWGQAERSGKGYIAQETARRARARKEGRL